VRAARWNPSRRVGFTPSGWARGRSPGGSPGTPNGKRPHAPTRPHIRVVSFRRVAERDHAQSETSNLRVGGSIPSGRTISRGVLPSPVGPGYPKTGPDSPKFTSWPSSPRRLEAPRRCSAWAARLTYSVVRRIAVRRSGPLIMLWQSKSRSRHGRWPTRISRVRAFGEAGFVDLTVSRPNSFSTNRKRSASSGGASLS